MVKSLNMVYELNTSVCDKQASEMDIIMDGYKDEVLRPNVGLFGMLFLHLADISNPMKPFDICRAWSTRVLDEFFAQGDEEKRIGIPVGILNDRHTVSRFGSQHGFILFLISPIVVAAVRVFQPL